MSTNYYLRLPRCDCCGRGEEYFHMGQNSGGWQFLWRAHPERNIDSVEKWAELVKKGTIEDEYDRVLTWEEFLALTKIQPGERERFDPSFRDANGNQFETAEFC